MHTYKWVAFYNNYVAYSPTPTPTLPYHPISAIIDTDMETLSSVLPYVQIILSIILVTVIMLQQRGSSLGGAFGSDNYSATFNQRRGAELFLFRLSIVVGILFVLSAIASLVI